MFQSGVGFNELDHLKDRLSVYPIPTTDELSLKFDTDIDDRFKKIAIYNSLGQILREEEIEFKNNKLSLRTTDLAGGFYLLKLKDQKGGEINKRFVIEK